MLFPLWYRTISWTLCVIWWKNTFPTKSYFHHLVTTREFLSIGKDYIPFGINCSVSSDVLLFFLVFLLHSSKVMMESRGCWRMPLSSGTPGLVSYLTGPQHSRPFYSQFDSYHTLIFQRDLVCCFSLSGGFYNVKIRNGLRVISLQTNFANNLN